MRLIDADVLIEILTTAIRNMKGMAKFLNAEDDPEIKMEIKAYTDILNGVKEQPTIEPERKKGKWVVDEKRFGDDGYHCDQCGAILEGDALVWRNNYYCYHCGADMRKEREDADNSQI